MIKISRDNTLLILEYWSERGETAWVRTQLKQDGHFNIKKTFSFEIDDLLNEDEREMVKADRENLENDDSEYGIEDFDHHDGSIFFKLAELQGDYFVVEPGKVTHQARIFLHHTLKLDNKLFVSHRNISVLAKLEKYVRKDIYIGGSHPDNIPEIVMWDLIKRFPNSHQKDLYEASVISGIIMDYVDNVPDYRSKYESYLNKKSSVRPSDLQPILADQELFKYKMILEKLETMLKQELTYSEAQWQEEILSIITLLYPKYIHAFKNVSIKRKNATNLFLDILLLDSGGYVDIIEIKKPFDSAVVSKNIYRDNHIPYKELAGTVMQIEKYIYYLNRWGPDGEIELTKRLNGKINGIEVKLTNPGGLIIMGRDNNLTPEQLADFEVIKRKYKNIMDILTYDELIRRLKFTINLWKRQDGETNLD